MSDVFSEAVIEWDGVEYTFVPSMRLIKSIERQKISLVHVYRQAIIGEPQTSLMACILTAILQSCGADVQEERIYLELNSSDPHRANDLYVQIMALLSPSSEKKTDAPSE